MTVEQWSLNGLRKINFIKLEPKTKNSILVI